jgi:secreted Zn-dependent insulinase-like peptidase
MLFTYLLKDDLKEYAYDAEMAGIEYKVSHDVYAIQVSEPFGLVSHSG